MISTKINKITLFKIPKINKTTQKNYNYGAVHPVTGKKPPTIEEYDPLNPGEWQIGVDGKLLPRLPEGTRCGKLVMGKYGLYSPEVRKRQIEFYKGSHEGTTPSEVGTKMHRLTRNIAALICIIGMVCSAHNFLAVTYPEGTAPFPYYAFKGKQEEEG